MEGGVGASSSIFGLSTVSIEKVLRTPNNYCAENTHTHTIHVIEETPHGQKVRKAQKHQRHIPNKQNKTAHQKSYVTKSAEIIGQKSKVRRQRIRPYYQIQTRSRVSANTEHLFCDTVRLTLFALLPDREFVTTAAAGNVGMNVSRRMLDKRERVTI